MSEKEYRELVTSIKLVEKYPRQAATIGFIVILLLFWLPLLEGLKAAFNRKHATVPEIYSEWFYTLKDFYKIARGFK